MDIQSYLFSNDITQVPKAQMQMQQIHTRLILMATEQEFVHSLEM